MPHVCNPLADSLSEYETRWSEFSRLLDDVSAKLAALDQSIVWQIVGASGTFIGTVSVEDFAHKFANISWSLTNKDYSDVNGGVGQVVSKYEGKVWRSAAEEIRASDFAVYMSWPAQKGATYLALHETAHTTELGLHLNRVLYDQFIHSGGQPDRYPDSPQWLYNEASTNLIARTVAEAIDFPILPHPTGGFPSLIRHLEIA
jgi:hypothetical protein